MSYLGECLHSDECRSS